VEERRAGPLRGGGDERRAFPIRRRPPNGAPRTEPIWTPGTSRACAWSIRLVDPDTLWLYDIRQAKERGLVAAGRLLDRANAILRKAKAEGRRPFYLDGEGHRVTELTLDERSDLFDALSRARRIIEEHSA
jgi:hypothetical protein